MLSSTWIKFLNKISAQELNVLWLIFNSLESMLHDKMNQQGTNWLDRSSKQTLTTWQTLLEEENFDSILWATKLKQNEHKGAWRSMCRWAQRWDRQKRTKNVIMVWLKQCIWYKILGLKIRVWQSGTWFHFDF